LSASTSSENAFGWGPTCAAGRRSVELHESDDLHDHVETAKAHAIAIAKVVGFVLLDHRLAHERAVGAGRIFDLELARPRRRVNHGVARRRGRMIDLDVEPRRGALAPNHVLTLIDGPKHAELGRVVAHQKARQHAQ